MKIMFFFKGRSSLFLLFIFTVTLATFMFTIRPNAVIFLQKQSAKLQDFFLSQYRHGPESQKQRYAPNRQLEKLASERAINRTIIISIVDLGYIEMALNLWETSFHRFGITNYVFICMNENVRHLLPKKAGECPIVDDGTFATSASLYGTAGFKLKVMLKTKLSLELLHLGYNVIVVDLDIVFLKNPMQYLKCSECDLVIQDNYKEELNTGFYLIRPTKAAIELQEKSIDTAEALTDNSDDQDIMNRLVKSSNSLKFVLLDINKFQPGILYFSSMKNFASDAKCEDCVIVHNNWVVGIRPKMYRFKEMLLWNVDTNGYYTSTENRYITYYNPRNTNREQEYRALELAFEIGRLLNRIVILPRFNCGSNRCNLLNAFGSDLFLSMDESSYRESVFLRHAKVPDSTKSSISPGINIAEFAVNASEPTSALAYKIVDKLLSNATLLNTHYKVLLFDALIPLDEIEKDEMVMSTAELVAYYSFHFAIILLVFVIVIYIKSKRLKSY